MLLERLNATSTPMAEALQPLVTTHLDTPTTKTSTSLPYPLATFDLQPPEQDTELNSADASVACIPAEGLLV